MLDRDGGLLDPRKNVQRITYNLDVPDEAPEWNVDFWTLETKINEHEFLVEPQERVVFIQGLPKVPAQKMGKLNKRLKREFIERYGETVQNSFYHPSEQNAEGDAMSLGFCFVEFQRSDAADKFVEDIHGNKFDSEHRLRVNLLASFEGIDVRSKFVKPDRKEFERSANFKNWWLFDNEQEMQFRTQYVIRYTNEARGDLKSRTEIYWNDPTRRGRVLTYGGEREEDQGKVVTYYPVEWSPLGTYLVTYHDRGVKLLGGKDWEELHKIIIGGVYQTWFSPRESYMITFAPDAERNAGANPNRNKKFETMVVWDVRSGKKLRPFEAGFGLVNYYEGHIFKWSHDDKFFARLDSSAYAAEPKSSAQADKITIFITPEMTKLNRTSYKTPGVIDFTWAPKKNFMAYTVREEENKITGASKPAAVHICEVTEKGVRNLGQKHFSRIDNQNITMNWHPSGNYLCVSFPTYKKAKRTKGFGKKGKHVKLLGKTHNLEIAFTRKRQIPITQLKIGADVAQFAWDPANPRFAIIANYQIPMGAGYREESKVEFYSVNDESNSITQLFQLDRRAGFLKWSPAGRYICIAGDPTLEFLDVEKVDQQDEPSIKEHGNMNDMYWSPCGRYMATCVGVPENTVASEAKEYGYKIWSFQGVEVWSQPIPQFHQFLWRPNPPSLLTPEHNQKVKKTFMKKYKNRFHSVDQAILDSGRSKEQKERKEMIAHWRQILLGYREYRHEVFRARAELRGGYTSDDPDQYEITEEQVEENIYFEKIEIKEEMITV